VTSLYTESGVVERELGCADEGIMCVENGEEASFNDGTGNRFRIGVIGSIAGVSSALSSVQERKGTYLYLSSPQSPTHEEPPNWNAKKEEREEQKNLNLTAPLSENLRCLGPATAIDART
jgi:hypothetical protein